MDLTTECDEALTKCLQPIVREMMMTSIENERNLIAKACYAPPVWRRGFDKRCLPRIRFAFLAMPDECNDVHLTEFAHMVAMWRNGWTAQLHA